MNVPMRRVRQTNQIEDVTSERATARQLTTNRHGFCATSPRCPTPTSPRPTRPPSAPFSRSYADLPDPARRQARPAPGALKAALKRRRAFILPRFAQAEDSWRIRECASYAVAITVLVEHACAVLAPHQADPPADPDPWPRILADPIARADGSSARVALFHAIVPAQGRRWIAREPLVQTLIANYFTDTDPAELRDIVGPAVAAFGHDRQAAWRPPNDDSQPSSANVRHRPPGSSSGNRAVRFARILARARTALSRLRRPDTRAARPGSTDTKIPETIGPQPRGVPAPRSASPEPAPETARSPKPKPRSRSPMTPGPPPKPHPAPPRHSTSTDATTRNPPASKPSRNRRSGPRVADLLDRLPTAPPSHAAATVDDRRAAPPRKPDIGDHGAATARIGHQPEYALSLAAENASRPTQQTIPFLLPGRAPDAIGQPLDIDALFPPTTDPTRVDPDTFAPWINFREHLVEALRSGAQTANGERSLVHLLEVGAFLVWPQVALPFADERGVAPTAVKSAMRAAHVLAVNLADRQQDRHAFPALTGDPKVTCHGVITLPEFLWPDASLRPIAPSAFVRPPAIYGQRYRRPR